jgi:hypothetical protein
MVERLEDRMVPSVFTVTTALDEFDGGTPANPAGPDGQLSLREAISAASNGDTIVFDESLSGSTIHLDPAKGELFIDKDLAILGLGADNLAVSGDISMSRVFEVAAGTTDTISDLTIKDGFSSQDGGGILTSGTLTISDSTITGNSAVGGAASPMKVAR